MPSSWSRIFTFILSDIVSSSVNPSASPRDSVCNRLVIAFHPPRCHVNVGVAAASISVDVDVSLSVAVAVAMAVGLSVSVDVSVSVTDAVIMSVSTAVAVNSVMALDTVVSFRSSSIRRYQHLIDFLEESISSFAAVLVLTGLET
jgi:hypothetical protein